jgi:hypothetical protein
MRVLATALACLLAVFSLTASGAYADPVYPLPTAGQGSVDSSVVQAGTCVTFSGSGFKPGTPVVIKDDGKVVRTVTADSSGTFSTPVCFSSNAHIGPHVLTGAGTGANGAARVVTAIVTVFGVTDTQPVSGGNGGGAGNGNGGGLPFTGLDVATLVALGLGLVLAGVGLATRGARRRRRPAAVAR